MFHPAERDFKALLEALPLCIILHDAQTKAILWANPAACKVLGFSIEELTPLKAPDMSQRTEKYRREIGLKWLEEAVRSGQHTIQWCYRAKDGVEILSEAIATRVSLTEREVLLVQFRDIGAEEQVKLELKRTESQLEYMARHNAMGEMAVAIAHELSQPLAATRNFIEGAIRRLPADDEAASKAVWGLHQATRQIEHASDIIKSVREYVVKLEQAEQRLDLNDILAESQYFIALKGEPAAVRLELSSSREPLMVNCEKVLIGQVILNLAFNAIDELMALPVERRSLRIYTQSAGDRVLLCVEDRGRGIQSGNEQKLFDGFFSSKVNGNGIGLALCKNIISRHRGDIWAENVNPCGARFCFSLPKA
ncbi:ATP-binding protein [Pseudomonas sp. R5(2019)]|uniref:PAS domain-containing sensor histidine kinase n=1 Tax=Pseudomonas sp. R5(2019) TaxID=2697566 RepID=UPI00141254C3|nr:ATP-binding protein [Pseudomonas sp. R5(2019)]NBA94759.1 PAS domain S-box protein [Pseudomonas sp. R5(2019)]